MKPSLRALLFSLLLETPAKAQQSAFPTATNSLATNTHNMIAEFRAKAENGHAAAQTQETI